MNELISQHKLNSQDFVMSQLNSSDMPADLLNAPRFKKLDHLVIRNFKSFKQQTFAGPFLNFTSIIGPNGSGKSNVLDALMFCLCGQNLKHNFFDLREYINRQKTESYKEMSKKKKVCSVAVTFYTQDGKPLQLKRELDPESNQYFFINLQEVPKKIYENFLFKQGINPHIPNYAITQGQIDKLLLKQPLDLARYIENLSGSFLFKRDYDSAKDEIQQIRRTVVSLSDKILKLKNEKKNAKNISDATKQCQDLQRQYERLTNLIFLAKVFLKEKDLQEMQEEIEKKKNEQKLRIEQINKKKLKIQQELRQKQEINKQINGVQRKIIELNSKLRTLNRPDLAIKTKQLEIQQKQLQYMQGQFKKLMEKKQKLQQQVPQTHSSQVVSQYLKLYSQWQNKNRQTNIQLQNKKTLYFNLQSQRQFQKSLLEAQQQKQKNYQQQDQKRKKDIELAKQQTNQINTLIQKLKKQVKNKEQMLNRNTGLLKQSKEQYQQLQNQVSNLEQLLTQNVQSNKDKEIIKKLCLIDGFRGMVQQKIRPKNGKYVVAFSILIVSIGKYILCKDENSSKQISSKLKDMNAIKTLLILNNVKKPNQSDSIKQKVGKLGISALDIIDLDRNQQGFEFFLEQFCRGKFICQTLNAAFEIRNMKIAGIRQIITLDGQVIKNDGTIASCGNVQHVKRTYRLGTNKKGLEQQLQKAIKLRDQLKLKVQNLQKQIKPEQQIKRNEQIMRLQKKKQDIQAKIQYLSAIKPKQIKSFKTIEKDITALTQRLTKVQKQIASIEKNMSKDQQMAGFMKKYNIQNLQSFRSASNLDFLQKQTKRRNQMLRQIDDINAKIESIKSKIDNRISRVTSLKNDLNNITNAQNKRQIQTQITKNQQLMKQLRQKVSQLGVYRDSDVQLRSEVIQMQTKYKFLKQKIRSNIQELRLQLGVTINAPRNREDWKPLQDYLSQGPLYTLTKRKFQSAIKDIQAQRNLSQQKIQKINALNLVAKRDQKDQADFAAQIKQLNQAVNQNNVRKTQLQKKLQEIKADRKDVFMKFFNELKDLLRKTYEVLTQGPNGISGKADLYLQSSDTPFDHGIYYTPTPPSRRFIYDLDQLSGGQKSIASLALQYALAVCSKSPFLILDESDAYLDSNNTMRLLNLLQNSPQDKKLQIILITHKPNMFSKCDSLVGVTRPKQQFSKVFSCKVP